MAEQCIVWTCRKDRATNWHCVEHIWFDRRFYRDILEGLRDIALGRMRPWSEVKKELGIKDLPRS